jgi:hypothetical protein
MTGIRKHPHVVSMGESALIPGTTGVYSQMTKWNTVSREAHESWNGALLAKVRLVWPEARKDPQRDHGPALTFILDFWP